MSLGSRIPKSPSGLISSLALILSLGLFTLLLWGVRAEFSIAAQILIFVIYLGIAWGLSFGTRWLTGGGWLGRVAGALGLGSVVAWQVREVGLVPESFLWLLGLILALPWLFVPWLRGLSETRGGHRDLVWSLALLWVVGLGVGMLYQSDSLWRWHLLRHTPSLGTAAFFAMDEPVDARRVTLYSRHQATGQVAVAEGVPSVQHSVEAAGQGDSRSEPESPNIVFILLDTLRKDALEGWGGDAEWMPRLNKRLESAWRFTDLWAASTWTRPSVASYFTGLQPEAHGARTIDDGLAQEHWTLAEALSARGYATTALMTNWGAAGAEVGFDQGFDTFHELRAKPYARAGSVRRAVKAWLEGRDSEAEEEMQPPAFLYLHFLDPHEPYLESDSPKFRTASERWSAYGAELSYLDRELDRVLTTLIDSFQGPTVFVLASDHGEEFYEHELFGHGFSLYEEVLSVPLAVWGTHLGAGESKARLEGRDVYDLVLNLADNPTLSVDQWGEEKDRAIRYASIDYSSEGRLILRPYLRDVLMRAIQDESTKAIWSAYGNTWEFYDLAEDPGETTNLFREYSDRLPEFARRMNAAVSRWRPGTPLVVSEESIDQMRALGYIDN